LDEFEKLILRFKDKEFLVINATGGNGDVLLLNGLIKKLKEFKIKFNVFSHNKYFKKYYKLFKKLGLKTKVLPLIFGKGKLEGDVVLIRGGGYFNDVWRDYYVLEDVLANFPDKPVILCPHTFYFKCTDFAKFFMNHKNFVYLFCREKTSFNIIHQVFSNYRNLLVNIFLSPDTAFYFSKEDFEFMNLGYTLNAFRNDVEAKVSSVDRSHDIVKIPYEVYVQKIINAGVVNTDRLHVAILGAITGKKTSLYANSYHKNKSVYDYSLKKFDNVTFIDRIP